MWSVRDLCAAGGDSSRRKGTDSNTNPRGDESVIKRSCWRVRVTKGGAGPVQTAARLAGWLCWRSWGLIIIGAAVFVVFGRQSCPFLFPPHFPPHGITSLGNWGGLRQCFSWKKPSPSTHLQQDLFWEQTHLSSQLNFQFNRPQFILGEFSLVHFSAANTANPVLTSQTRIPGSRVALLSHTLHLAWV